MALLTDDSDIRTVQMFIEFGGNGDFYINLMEKDKKISCNEKLVEVDIRINMRISMSGGNAPHDVKMAIANLYKAMEAHGLNKHPKDE